MKVKYDGAFEAVIRQQWLDLAEEQKRGAELPDRRGQLQPDAPDAHALRDTLRFQRGHADVFREVYKESRHVPPRKGERLLVVDIGAGAATVAVVMAEALGPRKRNRIDYLAFDPNPMMRKLGKRVLNHLDAGFRSAKYTKSLDQVDYADVERLLFAFSYVSHQNAVTPAHIDQWASHIARAVSEVGEGVELIYTTIDLVGGGALPTLGEKLDMAGINRTDEGISVQVHRCFPPRDLVEGLVRWDVQDEIWDVEAQHWTLRT